MEFLIAEQCANFGFMRLNLNVNQPQKKK